jgi:putative acetyltransferase
MNLRSETPQDIQAIHAVNEAAFPGPSEANLVDILRDAGKAIVSLVAEENGQVIGHVLFSPVTIEPESGSLKGIGLAPVAVLPEHQGKGTGTVLIRKGLEECRRLGFDYTVVLGSPRYYGRFGYRKASDFGVGNEYGVDDEFMVMEFKPGVLEGIRGVAKYAKEFEVAGC